MAFFSCLSFSCGRIELNGLTKQGIGRTHLCNCLGVKRLLGPTSLFRARLSIFEGLQCRSVRVGGHNKEAYLALIILQWIGITLLDARSFLASG